MYFLESLIEGIEGHEIQIADNGEIHKTKTKINSNDTDISKNRYLNFFFLQKNNTYIKDISKKWLNSTYNTDERVERLNIKM